MNETNAALTPLYTQNPLGRFSNRAEDYAKYRPSYPLEAIATLLNGLPSPSTLSAADIGAGTGISSRLVAEQGVRVWAIEPNAAMRGAAEPHPLVEFRDARAEQTGLPDQSVDLVICCQSFHWFEPEPTLKEFHRILKPSGRVALMWNERNLDDEFTHRYTEIVRTASDQRFFDHQDRKSSDALETSPLFTHFRQHSFIGSHELDLDSLIGLVLSASYVPREGAAYEQMMVDLRSLYDQSASQTSENGTLMRVSLSYNTNLYLADPISRHC